MEIKNEMDIEVFRNCESYMEVSNEEAREEAVPFPNAEKEKVLRGRPRKN